MLVRIAVVAAVAGIVAFALWHPARQPFAASRSAPIPTAVLAADDSPRYRRSDRAEGNDDALVVYVAGAVKNPGLYRLKSGERGAQAVTAAGGMTSQADAAAVNLAARAQDGDEIYVPKLGQARHASNAPRHSRRHAAPRDASVDVNRSDAQILAAVPGIGRSIAQRIVDLRDREGAFKSLDELLDVDGMTQTRLDRARPFLREP